MQLRIAPRVTATRLFCALAAASIAAAGCISTSTVTPSGSGGAPGTGGAPPPGTGGAPGSGGNGSGGANGSGGRTPTGSGGSDGNGGNIGATGSGGAPADGGARGTGGSQDAGRTSSACNAGPPSPPAGGASFPFPQNRASSACIYPTTCDDATVQMAWQTYKGRFITDGVAPAGSLRVQRPENGNDTVSEGISYGMLFSVYMNEKATFDKLWQYEQGHLDKQGLMNWHINASGTTAGANSATDADEDIGFALVMADKQWGGYTSVAKSYLATLLTNDFSATDGTIKGGDTYVAVNPSYLAPAFYKVFSTYTGDGGWDMVVTRSYALLSSAANATTGLVPDWSTGQRGPDYTYDATRTPYRIAVDACWTGDMRAQMFSTKLAAFFANIGAANIKDGYHLDGTVSGSYNNASFVGPAGVGAMAGNQQKLLDDAYAYVAKVATSSMGNYFDSSWSMFSLLMMTGNFLNLAAP